MNVVDEHLCLKIYDDVTISFFRVIADDEEDMLEHYLAEKSDSPSHSLRRAN